MPTWVRCLWLPRELNWWIGFMASAPFAIFLPGPTNVEAVTLSVAFTLLGAIGFLAGSLLMLPETIIPDEP